MECGIIGIYLCCFGCHCDWIVGNLVGCIGVVGVLNLAVERDGGK